MLIIKKSIVVLCKVALILLSLLTLFYILFRIYALTNASDEVLQDDSHLIPSMPSTDSSENGWDALVQVKNVSSMSDELSGDEMHDFTVGTWDYRRMESLLAPNQEAFDLWQSASQKKYIIWPTLLEMNLPQDFSSSIIFPSPNFQRKFTRYYLLSVRRDFENGDYERGLSRLDDHIRLISRESYSTSIGFLINLATQRITLDMIGDYFDSVPIYNDSSLFLQRSLGQFVHPTNGYENALKFEYVMTRNSLLEGRLETISVVEILEQKIPNYYYKPHKTINDYVIPNIERQIEYAQIPCTQTVQPYDRNYHIPGSRYAGLTDHFIENKIGKVLANVAYTSYDLVRVKKCEVVFRTMQVQVQLASHAYRRDVGRYPTSVEEMRLSGHLVVDVPDQINGWDVEYDMTTGKIAYPDDYLFDEMQ